MFARDRDRDFRPTPVPSSASAAAFTLVELLVVIGIIALLISILLPALNRARRAANTVACAANVRSILQGMQLYASEQRGSFPGGPNTSGRFLMGGVHNNANCPEISQIWDWQAPVARMINITFEAGPSIQERQARFQRLMEFPAFKCPENQFLATPFGGGGWPTITMNSYVTAMIFHMDHNPLENAGNGTTHARAEWNPPPGYTQKLVKVGDASRKIFIADGARYSNENVSPDYDFAFRGSYGGAYSDQGAFTKYSNSWNRIRSDSSPGKDPRLYAYRHGTDKPGGRDDAYRFNVGFFDGHVETMGDLEGSNPALWVPKGSTVNFSAGQMFADTLTLFGGAGGRPID